MPTLSPDGRHSPLSPVGGRQNLVVIDLAQRKAAAVTRMGDFDVVSVRWVGSNHLAFTLGDLEALAAQTIKTAGASSSWTGKASVSVSWPPRGGRPGAQPGPRA